MLNPDNKINVLHIVLSLEMGGLEKVVVECVPAFDRNIFNVEVCCIDELGCLSENLKNTNINITLLRKNQDHYDIFFPIKLSRLLRTKNIHILHMHTGTFFIGTQAGILAKTPVKIYTDHGRHLIEPRIIFFMDRFSGAFSDKIVAVSKELENYLIEVVKLPAYKTTTIINGIDTDTFSYKPKSLQLMNKLNIPVNHNIIGTVGRLAEVKDQSTMINALIKVRNCLPDTILLLIGDGPMRTELQTLVNNNGLRDHVKFVGNRDDVPDLLNLLDIFLLTSLSEGTSISLLEAMSSGVVPIVTKVGGNTSLVDNDINGKIINPKQVDKLAEDIVELLVNDDLRSSFSKNAINKVHEKFSLNNMINNYTTLYLNLCKSKRLFN